MLGNVAVSWFTRKGSETSRTVRTPDADVIQLNRVAWLVLIYRKTMFKHYKRVTLLLMLILAGCVSPTAKISKEVDASVRVSLPKVEPSQNPYVIVGFLTLKGHHLENPAELIRGLQAGDYRGKAIFSPQVYLNSNFEGRYADWHPVEVLNGFTQLTSGGKTETRPKFRTDRYGFEFTLGSRDSDVRWLSLVAEVPTWMESVASEQFKVAHTWTLNWGKLVDIRSPGWKVIRHTKSPSEINAGTEVIVLYLNRP